MWLPGSGTFDQDPAGASSALQQTTADMPSPPTGDRSANSAVPTGSPPASPSPSTGQDAVPDLLVEARSTGKFVTAAGRGPVVGNGRRVTYAVAVETGIDLAPAGFAAQVQTILGDAEGWASQDRWSLQRTTGRTDLVVRLATPATVDRVCATGGLRTNGYASCRVGQFVMVNVARWEHAIPEYDGDIDRYRHYVVNHEFGHGLGFGHNACPGKNKPAPVMQQQTYGLDGCTPNGSPYVRGRLLTGPPAP